MLKGSNLFLATMLCNFGVSAIFDQVFEYSHLSGITHVREVGEQAVITGILLLLVGLYFLYKYLHPLFKRRDLLFNSISTVTYFFWLLYVIYPYLQKEFYDFGKIGLIIVMSSNLILLVHFHRFINKQL